MSSSEGPQFTPSESALFYTIAKGLKDNMANINWEEVVANTGFKNVAVAKTRFKQILKKYDNNASASPAPANATTPGGSGVKKPRGRVGAKGKKAAAATAAAEASESDDAMDDTPTKKGGKVKEELLDDFDVKDEA